MSIGPIWLAQYVACTTTPAYLKVTRPVPAAGAVQVRVTEVLSSALECVMPLESYIL